MEPIVFPHTDPETVFRAAEMFIFPNSFRLYQRANNRLLIFDCWADKDDFGPVSEDPALTVEVLTVADNSVAYIQGADSEEVATLRAHLKALAAGKQPPETPEDPENPTPPPSAGDSASEPPRPWATSDPRYQERDKLIWECFIGGKTIRETAGTVDLSERSVTRVRGVLKRRLNDRE